MLGWLDAVILSAVVAFVLNSAFRGFLRELVVFAGILLGLYLGLRLYAPLSRLLPFYRRNPEAAHAAAFAVVFLLSWVVANLVGFYLRRSARDAGLEWADALGGMTFGLLKGVLLVSIGLLFLARFGDAKVAALIQRSRFASLMVAQARAVWNTLAG